MSSRDRGPDEARPIPQHREWDDDLGAEAPRPGGGEPFVVDTRRPGRREGAPRRPDHRGAVRRAPAGTLYPEDEGYDRRPDDARPPRSARPARSAGPEPRAAPGTHAPERRGPSRRRRKTRAVVLLVVLLLLAWVAFMVWVPFTAWGHVTRADDAPVGERPADTAGYNYLLVGSDGRGGLSADQVKALNAGGPVEGQRTDSIILVHVPQDGGKSALISIPRDSYVPIPGYRSNKINAAYAFGGPKLLEQTVEQVTGIRIDGYVEIGFGGFAGVVDSLGGVDVCVPFDMNDKDAAINLKKGCQTLDGATALGYVRARKSDPRGDIGRAERQRQFLGAIMKKAVTPSTVLIPWRYKGFADSAASGLVVGNETQLTDAARVLQALRGVDGGDTLSLVVPVADPGYQTPNAGLAVKWDTPRALALFTMLKNDEPLTVAPSGTTGR